MMKFLTSYFLSPSYAAVLEITMFSTSKTFTFREKKMFGLKCGCLKNMNLTFTITITNVISVAFFYYTVHVRKMSS